MSIATAYPRHSPMKETLTIITILLACGLVCHPRVMAAVGGEPVPRVWEGAAVNAFILPYTTIGRLGPTSGRKRLDG